MHDPLTGPGCKLRLKKSRPDPSYLLVVFARLTSSYLLKGASGWDNCDSQLELFVKSLVSFLSLCLSVSLCLSPLRPNLSPERRDGLTRRYQKAKSKRKQHRIKIGPDEATQS
jgi:hypothetical protein